MNTNIRFNPNLNATTIRMYDAGVQLVILWPNLWDELVEVMEYRKQGSSTLEWVTSYKASRLD